MGGPFFIVCSRMVVGYAGGRLPPLRSIGYKSALVGADSIRPP